MKKVKLKVKILAGAAIATTVIGVGHTYITNAEQQINLTSNSIQLNVEKQDRDTIKIYLSNFSDLAKSLQLSVKIDDGNVKFEEDSIKWLVGTDEDNIITDYKINSNKQELDLFMVSKEAINSDGGVIEICEIDVSKDESIMDKLFKSTDGSYKVVPNVIDGEAYSYVRYSTNKRIGGDDIANNSDSKLTINENPEIRLKANSSVIDNKIVILKGTIFNINDYVEAFDADGNEIENIEYSGKIDNKKAGSYNIICTATDSFGDTATLETTVMVEEFTSDNITNPIIYGAEKPIEIVIGESFDFKDGISALDYMGRELEVKVSGEYDIETIGKYTLIYTAEDRFGNTVTAERTLIVSEKASQPDDGNDVPGDDFNDDSSNGSGGNTDYEITDQLKDIIDTSIVKPVSGTGTISSPLLVEPEDVDSNRFIEFMGSISKFNIESGTVKEYENYKVVTLKLSAKHGNAKSINTKSNSEFVYLSIRVEKTKTEFMNVLDSFIEQNGILNEGNTGDSNDSENSNGSDSSGSSGSSSGSSSSDDLKYEIPSKLEGVIDFNTIKPIGGNGTFESPLEVQIKNISSKEFTGFLTKLAKFNIEINNIEENSEYKTVDLKLSEKYSVFNIMRFFRSSEDMYLSIKVEKNDSGLLSILNDFIAYNSSEDFEEEKDDNDNVTDEIQKPSQEVENTDKENDSNNAGINNNNDNLVKDNATFDNTISQSANNISDDESESLVSENTSGDEEYADDNDSETEANDDNEVSIESGDVAGEDKKSEEGIDKVESKPVQRKKIAAIILISMAASGILTSLLYYKIKRK